MALTWKDVAAPNYSGVQQGFESFSNMLGNALSSAERGLGKFDAGVSEKVNNELALRASKYTDAASYNAALADGSLVAGVDPKRISQENLRFMANRSNTLLQNQDLTGRIAKQEYDFTDQKNDDTARKNASGFITQYWDLNSKGDKAGAQALLNDPVNKALFAALDLKDQTDVLSKGFEYGNSDQQFRTTEFGFDRTKEDYADKKAADEAIAKVRPKITSYTEWERLRFGNDPAIKGLSPAALRAADSYFAGLFPVGGSGNSPGTTGSTGSTGSGGSSHAYMAGSPYNAVFGHGTYGLPDKPVDQMTIGEAVEYGRNVLIPATKGKIGKFGKDSKGNVIPLGTSAIGGYQFTQETLRTVAPIVFKDQPWQTLNMSPENQDKMARYLFEKNKGGNLQAIWEGLPDARPGAYKDKTFDQMKPLIFLKEAGSADLNAMNAAAKAGNEQKQSRGSQAPIYAQFPAAAKSEEDLGTVASKLTSKGTFKGANTDYVADTLKTISDRYDMVPAVAGLILSNAYTRATGPGFIFGENSGNGLRVDWGRVDALAKDWENFKFSEGNVGQQFVKDRGAALDAARTAYNQAEAILNDKLERARIQPGISVDVEMANFEKAKAALSAINLATRADPNMGSFREEGDVPKTSRGPIGYSSSFGSGNKAPATRPLKWPGG